MSTVAEKDGVQLIAVVMAAPDYKIRFKESEKLPEPIYTPSTKAELGDHDENISFEQT